MYGESSSFISLLSTSLPVKTVLLVNTGAPIPLSVVHSAMAKNKVRAKDQDTPHFCSTRQL